MVVPRKLKNYVQMIMKIKEDNLRAINIKSMTQGKKNQLQNQPPVLTHVKLYVNRLHQ